MNNCFGSQRVDSLMTDVADSIPKNDWWILMILVGASFRLSIFEVEASEQRQGLEVWVRWRELEKSFSLLQEKNGDHIFCKQMQVFTYVFFFLKKLIFIVSDFFLPLWGLKHIYRFVVPNGSNHVFQRNLRGQGAGTSRSEAWRTSFCFGSKTTTVARKGQGAMERHDFFLRKNGVYWELWQNQK